MEVQIVMAPLLEMKKLFTLVRVNVTFHIELSSKSDTDDDLFIIGNVPALGNWKHHKVQLTKKKKNYISNIKFMKTLKTNLLLKILIGVGNFKETN